MNFYERFVLPSLITTACSCSPVDKQRQKIVPAAEGVVLELGFGAGLNLPHYDASKVRKVYALEPSPGMVKRARKAARNASFEVEILPETAEAMIGGGCHLSRDIPGLINAAGFTVEKLDTMYLPKSPKWAGFNYWGSARPA